MAHVAIAVGMTVRQAIGVSIGIAIGLSVRMTINRRSIATEILSTLRRAIAHAIAHATLFRSLHLRLLAARALAPQRGEEVDKEAKHVETVDEGDCPLEASRDVPDMLLGADAEGDAEADLKDDEGELDPERVAQNRVLAVMDSEALVLPADEDGGDDVSNDEDGEKDVMKPVVVLAVKNGKQDQAGCSHNSGNAGAAGVDLLPDRSVGRKLACVSEVAFEEEGQTKCHDGNGRHGNE